MWIIVILLGLANQNDYKVLGIINLSYTAQD